VTNAHANAVDDTVQEKTQEAKAKARVVQLARTYE